MAPSRSSVTRLSGSGRSSPQSQKSTAWCARTSKGRSGESLPAHRGAWAWISSSSDLPSICMPPRGKSQSSAPRYQSFIASVFWNLVGLGSARRPSGRRCCAACSDGRPRPSRWPGRRGGDRCRDLSSRAAEFTAPHATTTMSPVNVVTEPSSRVATTPVTVWPDGSVSRRCTCAPVTRVTLSWARTGSTQMTCASDLASSRHGKPSTRSQRMQALPRAATPGCASWRLTPIGRWNGWRPCFSRSSLSCWMRGSWETGGWRYCALA